MSRRVFGVMFAIIILLGAGQVIDENFFLGLLLSLAGGYVLSDAFD